ncbi:hypothetical protein F5148DRAFT_1148843 [Russula earlei]|uniref:Uncharacterized protein n=1 Tax=Russula earlei TaxID=71964 RepID=A0ACC0UAQ0_9AGAM|nr:hypothetical protein F5148DRAFT_1148843 [Russula earlei]
MSEMSKLGRAGIVKILEEKWGEEAKETWDETCMGFFYSREREERGNRETCVVTSGLENLTILGQSVLSKSLTLRARGLVIAKGVGIAARQDGAGACLRRCVLECGRGVAKQEGAWRGCGVSYVSSRHGAAGVVQVVAIAVVFAAAVVVAEASGEPACVTVALTSSGRGVKVFSIAGGGGTVSGNHPAATVTRSSPLQVMAACGGEGGGVAELGFEAFLNFLGDAGGMRRRQCVIAGVAEAADRAETAVVETKIAGNMDATVDGACTATRKTAGDDTTEVAAGGAVLTMAGKAKTEAADDIGTEVVATDADECGAVATELHAMVCERGGEAAAVTIVAKQGRSQAGLKMAKGAAGMTGAGVGDVEVMGGEWETFWLLAIREEAGNKALDAYIIPTTVTVPTRHGHVRNSMDLFSEQNV